MRKFRVLGIALLVLLALASCRNYVWGPLPGWGGSSGKSYTAQQVAEAIPDELLVRFGLISNPEDLPEGVYVEQKFLSSTVETESYILSRSSVRSSSFSLQSLITLDGYLYNGAKFSTGNNPIVIAYPAIQDTSSYTVSDYTIEASGLSVVMPDSNTSTSVSFTLKGSIEAETSPSFTVDETTITIINPPQPENCIVDPYADNTGYVVGNQDVTAAEGKGMDGSSTSPYTISKLSDVAAINGLIQSQKESHFVLDNDLTLEESWILQNMVDLEVQEARPIKIPAGSNVTFDFNDHTITYNGISDVGQRPFVIEEGGSLVINNGTNNISDETIYNIRRKIVLKLIELGYNLKYKGTFYLIDAIEYCYTNNKSDTLNNLEKNVYMHVAKKYNKSLNNIKTNIIKATQMIEERYTTKNEYYTPKLVIILVLLHLKEITQ